jgi:hypothetical protein
MSQVETEMRAARLAQPGCKAIGFKEAFWTEVEKHGNDRVAVADALHTRFRQAAGGKIVDGGFWDRWTTGHFDSSSRATAAPVPAPAAAPAPPPKRTILELSNFDDDVRHASQYGGMFDTMGAADDDEGIVIDDKGDINELCDGSCKQSADCRKDHWCKGSNCSGRASRTPHRAARSAFGQHQNGKRQRGCLAGNAASHAKQEPVRQANADKRAEEASFSGFNVKALATQEIAKAKVAYERTLARFGHKDIDVYVFGASTGSKGYSLEEEAVHTIFAANGHNKPILRSSQWSSKKPDMCVIPKDERFSINDSDHVFLLADGNWRGDSGRELAHRIEKALHIFGEQHAAKAGGRITPLWRAHGAGYPKGTGPYKVGLLVIERDAERCLPFGWKRSDGK